jgi:hypothetical protein
MSLLGWLGSTTKVRERSLSPLLTKEERRKANSKEQRVVLGVLGTRSNIRLDELETMITEPLVALWGLPAEIVLPAEGDSSFALQVWAETKGIPVHLVSCDWAAQGRVAGRLRDARIQRDATHLLFLQGPRSTALTTLAGRLTRKGRPVFLSERPGLAATLYKKD